MAQTFDNQFFKVSGNYLATDFQDSGLDSSSEGLVEGLDFVHLGSLRGGLSETWTPRSVRATCYGIQMSVVNFYAIFELYCPARETLFTPIGELAWLCIRCKRSLPCQWDLSPMRSIFLTNQS